MRAVARWEQVALFIVLFACSGAVLSVVLVGDLPEDALVPESASRVLTLAWAPVYALMAMLVLPRLGAVLRALLAQPLLALLLLLALASSLWSVDPLLSLKRSLLLAACSCFGVSLGIRFSTEALLRRLARVLGACMILGLLFVIVAPGWGIMQLDHAGSWRGVFDHKNTLGQTATLALLVNLLLLTRDRHLRLARVGMLLLILLMLVMSGARTPLLALGGLAMLLLPVVVARASPGLFLPVLSGMLLLALVALSQLGALLEFVGRDTTLSGRSDLWQAVAEAIRQRWLLGYGFDAFWDTPDGPALGLWSRLGWQPPKAHDGFLDVTLSLGVVGLLLFVPLLARAAVAALRRLRAPSAIEAYWPLAYLGFLLLFGLVEINFLQPNGLYWIILVATVTGQRLARPATRAPRPRARTGAPPPRPGRGGPAAGAVPTAAADGRG